MILAMCLDLVINGPVQALGAASACFVCLVAAWFVERAIRRRARSRRDREWYRAPPKSMPKKWLR